MRRQPRHNAVKDHETATIDSLKADPAFALEYLNAVLEEGDEQELLLAMRRIANALGGIPTLAAKAELNPTTLYRTLSRDGNPALRSLTALLRAMGLRLAVQPLAAARLP